MLILSYKSTRPPFFQPNGNANTFFLRFFGRCVRFVMNSSPSDVSQLSPNGNAALMPMHFFCRYVRYVRFVMNQGPRREYPDRCREKKKGKRRKVPQTQQLLDNWSL